MILCAYRQEPNWPPDRPRFQLDHGGSTYWIETDGLPPSTAEMDEFFNPPPPPPPDALDAWDIITLKIAFNHENRIRALEGKAAVTVAQFKNAVKAIL